MDNQLFGRGEGRLAGEGRDPFMYFDVAHAPARPRGPRPPLSSSLVLASSRGGGDCGPVGSPPLGDLPGPAGAAAWRCVRVEVCGSYFAARRGEAVLRVDEGGGVPQTQNWHVWTVLAR